MKAAPIPYDTWVAEGRFAPFVRERKAAGGAVTMFELAQPAGDMSDPPVSDLVLIRMCSAVSHRSDFGAGRFERRSGEGSLLLIPPEVATDIAARSPHVLRVAAFPTRRYLPRLEEARGTANPFDFGHLHLGDFNSRPLLGLFDRLWAEAGAGSPEGPLLAEALSLQVLVELSRIAGSPPLPAGGRLAQWQERRCIEYLRAHAADGVSVSDLAAVARLSPFHFARMFKASTGLPPYAYQRRLRCERAQELLRDTDMPVTDVALAVGYATPQAFARMFLAETGSTPSARRREVAK